MQRLFVTYDIDNFYRAKRLKPKLCRRDIARRIQRRSILFREQKRRKFPSSAKFTATEPSSFHRDIFKASRDYARHSALIKLSPSNRSIFTSSIAYIFSKSSMLTRTGSAHSLMKPCRLLQFFKHFTPLIFKRGVVFASSWNLCTTSAFLSRALSQMPLHLSTARSRTTASQIAVPKSPK